MKNSGSLTKILTTGSLGLAIALIAGVTATAFAQEKGATRLLSSKPRPAAPGETATMSCSQCKDTTVTVTERPTKTGAKANTYTITRHECPGCKDVTTVTGQGKAAVSTVKHTCSLNKKEGATCCAKN